MLLIDTALFVMVLSETFGLDPSETSQKLTKISSATTDFVLWVTLANPASFLLDGSEYLVFLNTQVYFLRHRL